MIRERYDELSKKVDNLHIAASRFNPSSAIEVARFIGDLAEIEVSIMRLEDDLIHSGTYKSHEVFVENLHLKMREVQRTRYSSQRSAA